jgi:BirA family transcriptional regulator, biotin operon repressor / biotin---[acetyl-CoA-carboxylase] ligase
MLRYNPFDTSANLTLSQIDSTNIYAHHLIDDNKSVHGQFIIANKQMEGKGQRGKTWYHGLENEQLAASLILHHSGSDLQNIFILNMAVSLAICESLQSFMPDEKVYIKWSNDILVRQKKIAGILIENIIRGNTWTHSIIGVGVNINNNKFPEYLPNAISLKQCAGKDLNREAFSNKLYILLENYIQKARIEPKSILDLYNTKLFKYRSMSRFKAFDNIIEATIENVDCDGYIYLQSKDRIRKYAYGEIEQVWAN